MEEKKNEPRVEVVRSITLSVMRHFMQLFDVVPVKINGELVFVDADCSNCQHYRRYLSHKIPLPCGHENEKNSEVCVNLYEPYDIDKTIHGIWLKQGPGIPRY